jgi:hypothetical protein
MAVGFTRPGEVTVVAHPLAVVVVVEGCDVVDGAELLEPHAATSTAAPASAVSRVARRVMVRMVLRSPLIGGCGRVWSGVGWCVQVSMVWCRLDPSTPDAPTPYGFEGSDFDNHGSDERRRWCRKALSEERR